MKVKEFLAILERANPEAELDFKINPSNTEDENIDISAEIEVFGSDIIEEFELIEIIVTPKIKSSEDFETIYELIAECETVKIEINKSGMYIFGNGELRRELDFKTESPENRESLIVNKLIEIL